MYYYIFVLFITIIHVYIYIYIKYNSVDIPSIPPTLNLLVSTSFARNWRARMGTLRYVERTGARVFTWRRDVTFLGDPDARAWWFQTIVIICYNLAKVLGKSWQSLGKVLATRSLL